MTTTSFFTFLRRLSLTAAIILVVAACGAASDAGSEDNGPPQIDTSGAVATTRAGDQGHDDAADEHDDAADEHDETEAGHDDAADEHDETEAGHDDAADEHDETEAVHDDAAHDADRVVEISMTELAFTPDIVDVTAGETVTFLVRNEGIIDHEFRLSNAHRIEEHLASGHEGHDEGGGHHADADVVLQLEPGEEGEVTVTFPEDMSFFTEIACLIPGHYEAGMKGNLAYQ